MNDSIIQTYTGKLINPFEIKEEDIDIYDIAHSLSMQCRFNGNTKRFYSIAEHSINVSSVLKEMGLSYKTQLLGLLHDASEAYLSDVPSPVKKYLPDYLSLEGKLTTSICMALHPQYWDLTVSDLYLVNVIDEEITVLEGRYFLGGNIWDEMETVVLTSLNFCNDYTEEYFENMFLTYYHTLWKEIINEQATDRGRDK